MKLRRALCSLAFSFASCLAMAAEQEIEISTFDGLALSARLAMPDSVPAGKSLPAIVLVHGSGATDMDLWIPGNATATGRPTMPFREISESLTQAGFAVLRYNKRGVTEHQGDNAPVVDQRVFATATPDTLMRDVLSAVTYLRSQPNIDRSRIILLGMSEGTVLCPMAAEKDSRIAGLVLLGAMARNLRDTLSYQYVERNLDSLRTHVDANRDNRISAQELRVFPEVSLPLDKVDRDRDGLASLDEIRALFLGEFNGMLEKGLRSPMRPWFEGHFALSRNDLRVAKFRHPILILQGEADVQTQVSEAYLIESALRETAHPDFELKVFPGLGHGFSPNIGTNGILPTVGPFAPQVFDALRSWLAQRFADR